METAEFKTIKLEEVPAECEYSLYKAMHNRKTERNVSPDKFLTLTQLSHVLWFCYGKNREDGHKVVPSALFICPLEIYAFMKPGVFKYDPDKHELIPVIEGDHREDTTVKVDVSDPKIAQTFVKDAALNIVIMADLRKNGPFEEGKKMPVAVKEHCAVIDAGHCCQNVYLYCAKEGLKCCERGWLDEKVLKDLLKLDENYKAIINISVGP